MPRGRIIKSTGSWYTVSSSQGTHECRLRGKLRMEGKTFTNPLAVGDWVNFINEKDAAIIESVEPRRNYIVRKATKLSSKSHIIASNIDQAILIITPHSPQTSSVFIDRFLVLAEAYNIPVIMVFNKTDIYTENDLDLVAEWMAIYNEIGYEVMHTSVVKKQNITAFQKLLKNKTSVISGLSGVGKSSLINAVDADQELKTGAISEAHKSGKHTTSFAQMLELSFGGYIIDTPGVKALGMINLNINEISHYFPELFKMSKNCQFNNCTHTHEPGCAVIQAVELGEIAFSRYESYLNIVTDPDEKFRKDKYC
jgi:ribosome biogenesis GTPase